MNQVTEWLKDVAGLSPDTQGRLLSTLTLVFLLWGLRRLILSVAWRRVEAPRNRYRWQKTTTYVVVPLGILMIGRVWFEGFASLATYLGLASAGVAIALKDLLVNLAGWAFILWRRSFEVGDRIEIGPHRGDVIDVRIFQFSLMEVGNWVNADQSTGRVLHVPNGAVLTQTTANYSQGFQFIWHELPVVVTFESDWRKAKKLLAETVETHAAHLSAAAQEQVLQLSRRYMIFYTHLSPIVYTRVVDNGVELTMRYLCEPKKRRNSEEQLWEAVLDKFGASADIDFAYPTTRLYKNPAEGKPQTGGPPAPLPGVTATSAGTP